jgi:hypothetical protein
MEATVAEQKLQRSDRQQPRLLAAADFGGCEGLRRIWEVDPEALRLVLAVLLRRDDIEELFAHANERECDGIREDVLFAKAAVRCSRPCVFADAVARTMHVRTRSIGPRVQDCPLIDLAEWWASERDRVAGVELAALLWRLACDPRPHLEQLTTRVSGDLWLRGLRLLGRHCPEGSSEVLFETPTRR